MRAQRCVRDAVAHSRVRAGRRRRCSGARNRLTHGDIRGTTPPSSTAVASADDPPVVDMDADVDDGASPGESQAAVPIAGKAAPGGGGGGGDTRDVTRDAAARYRRSPLARAVTRGMVWGD